MKQTAVEQLGIAFREWQRDWDFFEERGKDKPVSFDEFINPYLEMEKQQIIDAYIRGNYKSNRDMYWKLESAEKHYNETFNK
jgi:hypothetical protein